MEYGLFIGAIENFALNYEMADMFLGIEKK